jgi:group I intron endonuclease
MKLMCIYSIKNIKNNKIYIGSAVDFHRRKRVHLNLLNKGKHHSIKLQNSFNKYGIDNFQFDVLENVYDVDSIIETEQRYLDDLKPELNMTLVAGLNSHIGLKRSLETIEKIRISNTGKSTSEETKEKLRKYNIGKKQSQETIDKKSKALYKPIIQINENGEFIEWDSATVASKILNISKRVIYACLWGKKKTYKKSKWIYK